MVRMQIIPMSAETIGEASRIADTIFTHDTDEMAPSGWFAASLAPGGTDEMRRQGEDVGRELSHWVAIDDGKVLGSTGLYTRPVDEDSGVTWLSWHCVSPDARGKRVGSTLLDFAIAQARMQSKRVLRLYTWTHPTENEAQTLYESRDLSLFRVERQRDGWEKMYRQLVLSPVPIAYSEEDPPTAGRSVHPDFRGLRFFGPSDCDVSFDAPKERTIIAVLTSIRRRAHECAGQQWATPDGVLKMEGTVDRLLASVRTGRLRQFVEVSSLIVNDAEEDLRHVGYPAEHSKGKTWIHYPYHSGLRRERAVRTARAPASYRRLKEDERRESAQSFVTSVDAHRKNGDAELLLCDDLDDETVELLAGSLDLDRRVLHIQPYSPAKGKGNAYMRAIRSSQGYWLDQHTGRTASATPEVRVGFRLSMVLPDTHIPVCEAVCTPVHPDDDRILLAHRNYQHSLPPLLLGLQHYIRNIHPFLWRASLRGFREIRVSMDAVPWRDAV